MSYLIFSHNNFDTIYMYVPTSLCRYHYYYYSYYYHYYYYYYYLLQYVNVHIYMWVCTLCR